CQDVALGLLIEIQERGHWYIRADMYKHVSARFALKTDWVFDRRSTTQVAQQALNCRTCSLRRLEIENLVLATDEASIAESLRNRSDLEMRELFPHQLDDMGASDCGAGTICRR